MYEVTIDTKKIVIDYHYIELMQNFMKKYNIPMNIGFMGNVSYSLFSFRFDTIELAAAFQMEVVSQLTSQSN